MKQSHILISPDPDARAGGPGASRRNILLTAGFVGAAAVADSVLGHASSAQYGPLAMRDAANVTTARPTWLAGPATTPTNNDWNALRRKLSTGRLVRPGQSAYNAARAMYDPRFDSLRPAGIAFCGRPSDVGACLSFVTSFKLPFRVRSGGHSYEGWSSLNNGLVIDVTDMHAMHFANNSVTVGSGIDLINFYNGLAARGKAVPGGSCPTVGIAGLALGGGVGVLARIYGLTCDAMQSVQLVTADGSTRTCNSHQNSDLYWASRGGGGGNFGVATSFTFGTHDLSSLVLFSATWPWAHAARVVSAWQSWAPHNPDAMWSNLHLSANTGGPPSLAVGGSFVGSVAGARALLDKLFHLVGTAPTSAPVVENSFLNAMLAEAGCFGTPVHACDTPPGGRLPHVPSFAKSDFFSKPLNSAGISALLRGIEQLRGVRGASGGNGSIAFDALGGKVNSVHPQATSFVHRDALFVAQYFTSWNSPGSARGTANQLRWLNSFYKSLHPHANGQAYQNYIDASLKNWRSAYYGINYTRLSEIKAMFDPQQLFNFPQAITPPARPRCEAVPSC